MSSGPRITLDQARRAAAALAERWQLDTLLPDHTPAGVVVGSVRRQRPEVGDLEIVAAMPATPRRGAITAADDPLFRRINESMANPWTDERAPLFGATPEPDPARIIGEAVRGLRPGFAAASLIVRPWPGVTLPVQVFRAPPEARGWLLLYRTGPAEFGAWFLGRWKRARGIPVGDDRHKASIDGHLVDAHGQIVPVPTEEEAFRLAGVAWIDPAGRDDFMARLQASREMLR